MNLLLLLALSGIISCKKQPEKTQVRTENISESVYASGFIKSRNQYQVFATVGGLIREILVKEGDLVKKGDPLFVVENETSRLNAENAQLAAEFATSNMQGDRLRELSSSIETARSKMMNDSILLIRQRGLWAQQIGSQMDLEQRELAYTSSLNNYQATISRYKDLQKQLRFSAAQSKKQLAISRNIAQDYVVRSQTAGRVYSLDKEVGEIVTSQSPIAVIGAAEEFVVELQVDENDVVRIRPGQQVLITMDSYKGQVFAGQVATIDPIMNERSRTFLVEAVFTKQPPTLYPNLTVEANIVIQSKAGALTIPRAYLIGDSAVMLENSEQRKVVLGLRDYQKAEITSGLSAGDIILKPGK